MGIVGIVNLPLILKTKELLGFNKTKLNVLTYFLLEGESTGVMKGEGPATGDDCCTAGSIL